VPIHLAQSPTELPRGFGSRRTRPAPRESWWLLPAPAQWHCSQVVSVSRCALSVLAALRNTGPGATPVKVKVPCAPVTVVALAPLTVTPASGVGVGFLWFVTVPVQTFAPKSLSSTRFCSARMRALAEARCSDPCTSPHASVHALVDAARCSDSSALGQLFRHARPRAWLR
jgi:hypothetical protein